jgi:hypothetical protein
MARSLGALEAVTDLISGMSESDMRLFLYSAMNASKISKNTKFSYGEKVYFNLSAPYVEFIDSYYSGVVVAYIQGDENSEGGYLQIAGSLSGGAGSSIILPVDSILSQKAWNKLYKRLLNANRFYTPINNRLRIECSDPTTPDDYVVSINLSQSGTRTGSASFKSSSLGGLYLTPVIRSRNRRRYSNTSCVPIVITCRCS